MKTQGVRVFKKSENHEISRILCPKLEILEPPKYLLIPSFFGGGAFFFRPWFLGGVLFWCKNKVFHQNTLIFGKKHAKIAESDILQTQCISTIQFFLCSRVKVTCRVEVSRCYDQFYTRHALEKVWAIFAYFWISGCGMDDQVMAMWRGLVCFGVFFSPTILVPE